MENRPSLPPFTGETTLEKAGLGCRLSQRLWYFTALGGPAFTLKLTISVSFLGLVVEQLDLCWVRHFDTFFIQRDADRLNNLAEGVNL